MLWWRGECWLLRKKVILVEVYSPRRENIGVLQMFSSVFHMYWNLLSTLFCYLFPFSYSLSLIAARNVLSGQHSPRDDHWDFNGFFENFWKIKIKPLYQPFLLKLHQDISFMSKKSKCCFFSSVYLCGEQVLHCVGGVECIENVHNSFLCAKFYRVFFLLLEKTNDKWRMMGY